MNHLLRLPPTILPHSNLTKQMQTLTMRNSPNSLNLAIPTTNPRQCLLQFWILVLLLREPDTQQIEDDGELSRRAATREVAGGFVMLDDTVEVPFCL